MGYSLFFTRLPSYGQREFPFNFNELNLDDETAKLESLDEACSLVKNYPGMIPNGSPDSNSFRKELPNGDTLWCGVIEGGFSIDHSPRKAVLDLFIYLKQYYRDLVILDPQEGNALDEKSFEV